jgi:trimeric autotransporter adhesin
MAPQSWCVHATVSLLVLSAGCGEDELGPRIPASIVVVPNEPRVPIRQTKQLTATVVDAAGRAIDDQPLDFTSSHPNILTVSATGLLTSVGSLGQARITVAAGELTAGVDALVVFPPSAIVAQPATLELQRGQQAGLWVTVTNELGDPIAAPVTYGTTNPAVATVDGFGLVTAQQNGAAAIVVSSPDRDDVQVPVTVAQIPTTLQVTPTNLVIPPGGQQALSAVVLDVIGDPMPGQPITYASDAPAVATVSSSGVVRAVAVGSTVITVRSGSLSATAGVFVGSAPPGTILATAPLLGTPWGARALGDRYLVTGAGGQLFGGQGTGFTFPMSLDISGLILDVELNAAGTRAYVAASATLDGVEGIGVVDLTTSTVEDVFPGAGTGTMFAVALSPDESHLFVGTASGVEWINLATRAATVVPGITGSVTAFSRHPTAPRLYGNMGYAAVVEIDAESGTVLRTFTLAEQGLGGMLQGTAVAPDGSHVYAALEDGDLLSWNLATGALGPKLVGGGGFGLALSPDGQFLYVGRRGDVLILDRASLVLLRTVSVGGWTRRMAVRSDGVALATNESGWVNFIK